jgi:hypothetical protein
MNKPKFESAVIVWRKIVNDPLLRGLINLSVDFEKLSPNVQKKAIEDLPIILADSHMDYYIKHPEEFWQFYHAVKKIVEAKKT